MTTKAIEVNEKLTPTQRHRDTTKKSYYNKCTRTFYYNNPYI